MVIENFLKNFDNSILKCKEEGNSNLKRSFKLLLQKPEHENTALGIRDMNATKSQTNRNNRKKTKESKRILNCVVVEDTPEKASYIWKSGKLQKISVSHDDETKRMKCKVVPRGFQQLNLMIHEMKGISKIFRKLNNNLDKFASLSNEL